MDPSMDFTQDDTIDIFTSPEAKLRSFGDGSSEKSFRNKSKTENQVSLYSKKSDRDIGATDPKEEITRYSSEQDFNLNFIESKQASQFPELEIDNVKRAELYSLFNRFSLIINRLPIDKYKPIFPKAKRKRGKAAKKLKKSAKIVKQLNTKPITEDPANYARNRTRSETKIQPPILSETEITLPDPPKRRKSAPILKEPSPVLTVPDSTVQEPCPMIDMKDDEPSLKLEEAPKTVKPLIIPIKNETPKSATGNASTSFYAEEDIINIQISPLYLSENLSLLENCESESLFSKDTPVKEKRAKRSPTQKVSPSSSSRKSQSKRSPTRSSRRSPRRSPSRRDSSRNSPTRSPNRRSSTRWGSPRRSPSRRTPTRKSSPTGKSSPRRSPARKSSPKRSPLRKNSPRTSPSRKSPQRRSPNRKSSPKRSPIRTSVKRSPVRYSPSRNSPPKRSPSRKCSPIRSPIRRNSPRRSPSRRNSPRRSPGRRHSPRRSSPRRSSPRRGSPGRRSPQRRSPYRRSPAGESGRRTPPRRSPVRGRSFSPPRRSDRKSPIRRSPRRNSPRRSPRRLSPRKSPSRRSPNRSSPRRSPIIAPPRINPTHNPLHNYRIPRRSPNRYQGDEASRDTRRSPIVFSSERYSDRSRSPNWDHESSRGHGEYDRQQRQISPRRDIPEKRPERFIQHTKGPPVKKIIRMESPVSMSISPETSAQEDDGDTWRIVSRSSAKSRVNRFDQPIRPISRSASPNRRSVHVHDGFFDSDSGSPLQHEALQREIGRAYSPKHSDHSDGNRVQFVSYNYNQYTDNVNKPKKTDVASLIEDMFSNESQTQSHTQSETQPEESEPTIYLPTEHYLPKDIPLPLPGDSDKEATHIPFSERTVKCPLCKSVLFAKRYELHIREKCMQRHKLNPKLNENKSDKSHPASSSSSDSAEPYVLSKITPTELRPFKCPDKSCEYIDRIANIRQHYVEMHMFMVCFNCNLRIIDPNTFPHHLSQCHNRVPAICHLCTNHYGIPNSFSLGLHLIKDHNTETCPICQHSVSLRNFPVHMKRCMFNSQHRFRCPICNASVRIDNMAHHILTQHYRDVCAICKRFTGVKRAVHVSRCFLDAAFLNMKNTQPETMVKCTLCSTQTTFFDISSHILKEHPHARCIFCEGIFTVKEFATHVGICCQRYEGIPISSSPQVKRTPIVSYTPPSSNIITQMPPVMYPTFNYPSNPHLLHNKGYLSPPPLVHQTPSNIFRTPPPRIFPSTQYGIRKSFTN